VLSDAQHTGFGESFVIFGFGAYSDAVIQDVVSTEHLRTGFTLEGERETYLHWIAFRMLTDASHHPAASRALILETAESTGPVPGSARTHKRAQAAPLTVLWRRSPAPSVRYA